MLNNTGDSLLDLFSQCEGRAIIVCPFIKQQALKRLLPVLDSETELTVYTRWVPMEVAMGVSDLEVLDAVEEAGGAVRLLRELHAKVYVGDGRALVGSTNLTGPGTGWSSLPNVEILVGAPADTGPVHALLGWLDNVAQFATRQLRDAVAEAAEGLLAEGAAIADALGEPVLADQRSPQVWTPRCTEPRRLWSVYQGDTARMLDSTVEDASADLRFLQPPGGLNKTMFVAHVRAMLTQSAVFGLVDSAFGAGGNPDIPGLLSSRYGMEKEDSVMVWDVLREWLLYFFNDRYRAVAPSEEVRVVRARRA